MSGVSDLENTESESSSNLEDLEVQLYGLIHYATDSVDAVATESISTETNKSHNQQNSSKKDQVSSFSIQNSSETVDVNSDHQTATEWNKPLCIIKHKALKSSCKKPEKIIDYLTLLKEYKTAKAQQNFAEMSRNPSLLWCHKQQDLARGYRKRYWMKETSDQLDNAAINHNSDPPFHIFHNSSYSDNRNEINYRKESSVTPENTEAFVTQQFNGYTFQDQGLRECDGSSAAKKSRNSLDTMVNHINHNANNYEIPYQKKKKKKKHKQRNSIQNANIDLISRAEITNSSNSAKAPKHQNKSEQQEEVRENIMNHTFDKNINNDDIDSRYTIVPSKKEEDDVIVLDSTDSESSIVVLGSPPTPEPPPVVCLDSDNENRRHQQETATVKLILNVTAPKQPFRENIQGNEMIEDNLTSNPSSTNKASSSSTSQGTTRAKRHRGVNDCRKWTAEMISYYNESWGGEHFDVISLQRQMSNNPVKWHVSERDLQMSFYQKRHKDKCTNCNAFGHSNWQCPQPARAVCCKMCGEQGHTEPRCPFPICLKCGERTMVYVRSCRNCRNKSSCTVCNKNGHSHDICPEVWRRYCTTTSLQIQRPHGPVYKPKEQQWCCVCAKKGHFPEDCQPFYVEPMTCQINKTQTSKAKKKKKKYYMQFHKRKVHFGMPC